MKAPIRSITSPSIGIVSGENPDRRSGRHQPFGFLIAQGDNIKEGHAMDDVSILDIAPTLQHLMNITPEMDFDGRVLTEIIRNS